MLLLSLMWIPWECAAMPPPPLHASSHVLSVTIKVDVGLTCRTCLFFLLVRSGEVAAAVADVESVELYLNAVTLARFRPHIQSTGLLVVETNLEAGALEMVCSTAAVAGVPVLLEPVSVPKSVRCETAVTGSMWSRR